MSSTIPLRRSKRNCQRKIGLKPTISLSPPIPKSKKATDTQRANSHKPSSKTVKSLKVDDDNFWRNKINSLDYCVVCLVKCSGANNAHSLIKMDQVWFLLNKPNLFDDYMFILGKTKNGAYMESKVPRICRSCLENIKALNTLLVKVEEITRQIETGAAKLRRKMQAFNFQKKCSELENVMHQANLPFRCMSNTIQFLSILHKPSQLVRLNFMDPLYRNTKASSKIFHKPFQEDTRVTHSSNSTSNVAVDSMEDVVTVDLEDNVSMDDVGTEDVVVKIEDETETYSSESDNEDIRDTDSDESEVELSCPVCQKKFQSQGKDLLVRHWWNEHILDKNQDVENHDSSENVTPKCAKCGETFKYNYALQYHVEHEKEKCKLNHSTADDDHVCDICEKTFCSKRNVLRHKRSVHGVPTEGSERQYHCKICKKSFGKVEELNRHKKSKHPKKTPERAGRAVCEFCGKTFSSIKCLRKHRSVHNGTKPFTCETCGKTFRLKSFLTDHNRYVHYSIMSGRPEPSCDICGKKFKTPRYLRDHMTIHTGGLSFQCDLCGRQFRKKTNMIGHKKRVHSKEAQKRQPTHNPATGKLRPICVYCNNSFYDSMTLRKHIQMKHVEKYRLKHSCDVCKEKFASKYDLRYHVNRVHMKAKTSVETEVQTSSTVPEASITRDGGVEIVSNEKNASTSSSMPSEQQQVMNALGGESGVST